jgi:hypothetical protein
MRTRRRFQPMIDGLPYRIAPSAVVVAAPVSLIASATPPASPVIPTMLPGDSDPPETGTPTELLVAPPPSGGGGTLNC